MTLLILFLLSLFGKVETPQNQKPNVLMILVDDLKPNIGTYGDPIAITPNIDRLASWGVKFSMAYCNQAVCMPSRYNLLLGSRSTSTGLYNFGMEFRDKYPDALTLPQLFMQAGYHAESMGKVYHIGHGNTNDEASWSIPHHKEKVIEYILPESTNRQLTREEAYFENTPLYFEDFPPNHQLPRGAAWEAADVLDEAYADGRVARHAIDRMRELVEKPEKPFFMAVGFARPHLPFCVPKKYWDLYDPQQLPMPEFEDFPEDAPPFAGKRGGEINQFKPIPQTNGIYSDSLKRALIHGYYASISYTDTQIGKVLDELKRLGLDKNTIIVLWGDHGWHLGDHGTWTKHTNYEQANRIPIMFVAPNVTTPGTTTQQMAETVDIYPTLADLAGISIPETDQPIDGLSLVPVLKDTDKSIRNHSYHAYPRGSRIGCAIRTDRYRMVAWIDQKDETANPIYELYDYKTDPLETKNIAADNPKVIKELKKILDTHPKPAKPAK
ncbi:MAG: sulfatase [Bacteroidota bacterium]